MLKPNFNILEYFLDIIINEPLEEIGNTRDLGIIVDSKLQFTDHINHVLNWAKKQFGFIMRHSKDFKNKETLRLGL